MLGLSTTEAMDWTQDTVYIDALLAVEAAAEDARGAEEERVRLLRTLQPVDDGLRHAEPSSLRYLTVKERADDLRRLAEEAERARCAAEQAAKIRCLPLWLDELRERFGAVADKTESLAEAFRHLEEFSDRCNVARMGIPDLRIGSGQVNAAGLVHWLTVSRKEVDQQLARKK